MSYYIKKLFDYEKINNLEMANNHSGSLNHGKDIVDAYYEICQSYMIKFEFVFKFQYRNLDTFIRPDMKGDISIPLIKRFSETRLSEEEYIELLDYCKEKKIWGYGYTF